MLLPQPTFDAIPGIEPGPYLWEVSAPATAPSLLLSYRVKWFQLFSCLYLGHHSTSDVWQTRCFYQWLDWRYFFHAMETNLESKEGMLWYLLAQHGLHKEKTILEELPHVDFVSTKCWRVVSEDVKCLFYVCSLRKCKGKKEEWFTFPRSGFSIECRDWE